MSTPISSGASGSTCAALRTLLVLTVVARPRLPAGDDRRRPGRRSTARPTAPWSRRDGKVVGSALIGQASPAGQERHEATECRRPGTSRPGPPRPATATTRWPPRRSNLGPENPDLLAADRGAPRRGRRGSTASPRPQVPAGRPARPAAPASTRTSARRTPRSRSPGSPARAGWPSADGRGAGRRAHRRAGRSASSASRGSTCSSSTSPWTPRGR